MKPKSKSSAASKRKLKMSPPPTTSKKPRNPTDKSIPTVTGLPPKPIDTENNPPGTSTDMVQQTAIPPLVIQNDKWEAKKLINFIQTNVTNNDFRMKCNGKSTVVHLKNVPDYNKIKGILINNKIPFFSFGLKSERMNKFIIKGLPSSFSDSDVQEELTKHNINVVSVRQFVKNNNTPEGPTKTKLPIFVVTVGPDTTITQLTAVKTVLYHTFKVEKFKPNSQPTQCFKCQRFGHVSSHCHLNPRCVKCAEHHEIQNCSSSTLKCANCGDEHTASYRQCPVRLKAIAQAAATKTQGLPPPTAPVQEPPSSTSTSRSTDRPKLNPITESDSAPTSPRSLYSSFFTQNDSPRSTRAIHRPLQTSRTSANSIEDKNLSLINNYISSTKTIVDELNALNIPQIIEDLKSMIIKLKSASNPIDKVHILASYEYLFDTTNTQPTIPVTNP